MFTNIKTRTFLSFNDSLEARDAFIFLHIYQQGCNVSTTCQNLTFSVLCCQRVKSVMIMYVRLPFSITFILHL